MCIKFCAATKNLVISHRLLYLLDSYWDAFFAKVSVATVGDQYIVFYADAAETDILFHFPEVDKRGVDVFGSPLIYQCRNKIDPWLDSENHAFFQILAHA